MNGLEELSPETLAATPPAVQEALRRMQENLRTLTLKNEKLIYELAYLKRIRFGRRAETLNASQRLLFEDDLDGDLGAVEAESTPLTRPATTRARAGRQTLPAHLERIEVRHEPESCSCPRCQAALVQIGEDVHEQLDVEPARFFVLRHIRPQYACRQCETLTAAPVAPAVIDGGLAAPGLLAWVAVGKYLDHLPLYRLEQISGRAGVSLSRSTMSAWIGRIGVALAPLAERLGTRLRQGSVLHADETPVQQLDPGSGKTRRGYLWSYRSNDLEGAPPIVVFDYQPSRSGQHVARFLEGWAGALMVDDYGGYKALFGPDITELACLAHVRRKFFDLQAAGGHPVAEAALTRIATLYAIEEAGRDLDIQARGQLRAQSSLVELHALHDWLIEQRLKTAHGSALARALDYTLKRWPALLRYTQSGHLPIDNNPVENAIRPIAIGKNYPRSTIMQGWSPKAHASTAVRVRRFA